MTGGLHFHLPADDLLALVIFNSEIAPKCPFGNIGFPDRVTRPDRQAVIQKQQSNECSIAANQVTDCFI